MYFSEMLKSGAQKLIAQAVETELEQLLAQYSPLKFESGQQGLVRNGCLPERSTHTGLGDVVVKIPTVRDPEK